MRCATLIILALILAIATSTGCRSVQPHHAPPIPVTPPPPDMPRELSKVVLPAYTIEPPDILVVEAIRIVPKSPYALRTGDVISIDVPNALPGAPIAGPYTVLPGGAVNLGREYGAIQIGGLNIHQAQIEITNYLIARAGLKLQPNDVYVALVELSGSQQISGQHMVGPDGMITLGSYDSVSVVGKTVAEAKAAIETHLARTLEQPVVAVNVFAYNSKVYYVITEGGGLGDTVTKFPVTGNETVLDAIANINGLTEVSSKKIWIARPVQDGSDVLILPVDWQGIAANGKSTTNYQVLPGDRVFIAEDKMVAFDSRLAKLLAPLERAMGFALLGAGTATRFHGKVLQGGGNPRGGGGFSGP